MPEHPDDGESRDDSLYAEADDLIEFEDTPGRIGRIGARPVIPSLLQRIRSALGPAEEEPEADDLVAAEGAQRRIGRIGARPLTRSLLQRIRAVLPSRRHREQEPELEELAEADDLLPSRSLFEISIDGKNYKCEGWETIEEARVLERRYDKGWLAGCGYFSEELQTRPDQFYMGWQVDTMTYPYIRLRPSSAKVAVANVLGSDPTYFWVLEDSGATEYLYIFSGRYAKKVKLSDNTLQSTKDFGAGANCGRPVLFEGKLRIPLGNTVEWVTLTTVAVGAAADTYTGATAGGSPAGSRMATHFALTMIEDTAELWRSHNNDTDAAPDAGVESCRVSGSGDAITFGASSEVGDTSLAITDLLSIGGQLMVMKPDAPWRFSNDGGGTAYPIMEFVSKQRYLSGYTGEDGSNSGWHGPYGYWTHSSGLWRVFEDSARPVDVQSNPHFTGIALDGLLPSFFHRWTSISGWGLWIYATESGGTLWQGRVQEDGSILWGGILLRTGFIMRCAVVATSTQPILVMLDSNSDLYRFNLAEDGSVRDILSDPGKYRGGASETYGFWAPQTNLGQGGKTLQLRTMWVEIDNMPTDDPATFTLQLYVHRDRNATPTQVGNNIPNTSGSGLHEESMTPGTNETFRSVIPYIKATTTGSFDPDNEDPRIVAFGLRAVTPTVYRLTIPLDASAIRGGSLTTKDALIALRNLKSGASISIREPGFNATFTGYVRDVQERIMHQHGVTRYVLQIDVERWVL